MIVPLVMFLVSVDCTVRPDACRQTFAVDQPMNRVRIGDQQQTLPVGTVVQWMPAPDDGHNLVRTPSTVHEETWPALKTHEDVHVAHGQLADGRAVEFAFTPRLIPREHGVMDGMTLPTACAPCARSGVCAPSSGCCVYQNHTDYQCQCDDGYTDNKGSGCARPCGKHPRFPRGHFVCDDDGGYSHVHHKCQSGWYGLGCDRTCAGGPHCPVRGQVCRPVLNAGHVQFQCV